MAAHKKPWLHPLTLEEFEAEKANIKAYLKSCKRVLKPSTAKHKLRQAWPYVRLLRGEGATWEQCARILYEKYGIRGADGKAVSTPSIINVAREFGDTQGR